MNKRIEELIVQAGDYVNETYTGPVPTTFTGNPVWHKEFDKWTQFSEKFAELIVKECRDIVEQDMKLAHIQMIPLTLEKYANGRLKEKIKEHFGVEE